MHDPDAPTSQHVVLLSVPGLRAQDLTVMSHLGRQMAAGERATLTPSFPAVTCPVQANMLTGTLPREHGIVANGFYWRDRQQVEMWTAWNDCIERPQIWDQLHEANRSITSAVWFMLHSKGSGADYICTPAPIHERDGSESPWCHTRPETLYPELLDKLGHFPLHHFWGPLAGIQSSAWIVDSAIEAARRYHPNFFYIYLPHLDYAAQKFGPDTSKARAALGQLDTELGKLFDGFKKAQGDTLWIVASEYAIRPVNKVTYPNRILRRADLVAVRKEEDGEHLDLENSPAWALADHQVAHVFVRDQDPAMIERVATLFRNEKGVAEVLVGEGLKKYGLDHPRSGDVVLVSEPDTWFAYYWWLDSRRAPAFARTVDIHRKPGYDPVELFFDAKTKSVPLDPTLVKGSHGAPAVKANQRGVILSSMVGTLNTSSMRDIDVAKVVLRQFGL